MKKQKRLLLTALCIPILFYLPLFAQTNSVDFNANGTVDFPDLLAFAQAFGTTQALFDLNTNGTVDFPDFLIFAQIFSESNKPEKEITIDLPNNVTMAFTYIQRGTFGFGLEHARRSHDHVRQDELPQHEVTFSRSFYMGTYEVTQAQWEAVMGTTPWKGQKFVVESPQHPAVYISWYDAHEFMHKLNVAAGDSLYRLPTEAEWEYAYRAGTTTEYFWGDDWNQRTTYSALLTFEAPAVSVGTVQPNPWGLYDMAGNISEWCQDKYQRYSSEPQTDPLLLPTSTLNRIERLGPEASRRRQLWPGTLTYKTGFRLVRMVK